jgi:hypothetical protein
MSMISLRRKPNPAGAIATVLSIAALMALPVVAHGAPASGGAQLAFDPLSYDFGLQQANSYPSQTTLQLRNEGEATEQILSLDVAGDSGAFRINGTDCGSRTLVPGEACWAQVEFNPYEARPFAAEARAYVEGGAVVTAALSGEGGRASLGPTVDPTSFGTAVVGSAGVTRAIEIRNTGNMTGGLFIAVIAGGAVGSFHLLDEDCTGIPLTPAGACNLLVSFQPLSAGVKTARLGLFGESDGGTGVVLSGVGVEPEGEKAADSPSAEAAQPQAQTHRRRKPRRHNGALRRRHRAALSARRVSH